MSRERKKEERKRKKGKRKRERGGRVRKEVREGTFLLWGNHASLFSALQLGEDLFIHSLKIFELSDLILESQNMEINSR